MSLKSAMLNKLRDLARGQECQVRIPGVCNGDCETTVLAHIRRGGVGGMGRKPSDLCGVWACSSCHDVIDGRSGKAVPQLDTYILEGLCRTLEAVNVSR